jgi:hypothetical protein
MNPFLIIGAYLGITGIGVVLAKVLAYHRPPLSQNASCFFNWLILVLMVLGLPWLISFKLIRQENWVNQLLLYLQLQRLPMHAPEAVQELFDLWTQQHRLETQKRSGGQKDFHLADEQVRWLKTRQVLLDYAYAKPHLATDPRLGIEYLQTSYPDSAHYYFLGKVCLVRTGQAAYGIYAEFYALD